MREQPWMRHRSHQMTTLVSGRKDDNAILSQARGMRSALVNRLYYTNVSCEWVSCLHLPSIFWNSFQETEITTIYQMMWNTRSSNLFAIVSFATAKLKMKTLPTGFPVALSSTAIQFSDRHSDRSFLLRIGDLLVDVVDVLDVSVSEIVAFPPGEHLAFLGIVLMQRQIVGAVEEASEAHQHSNEESNVWRSVTAQLSLLNSRVFQERCDRKA